ncbi:unnamed protein product [Prunus armeniaca]|uniref:Uncharacterized protein n=1 Tax=Prunus armeniaca TaxID=36596 RepID=A0A6J5TM18_PRUAR|nr:unnamed protein product [Prunus armeniaca]
MFMISSLGGLGDSLVFFSIFFALLLVLWADPSSKYRKRRWIPRPMFYELYKSSELSSADGDIERGKRAEN